ncbi:MAG: hypothetical protein R8G34_05875 [Paracoccaceae bacterium]|nr:hypothetical protein [Paracoccaceae bacterium]
MRQEKQLNADKAQTALIYYRISDKNQETDGHGLESQEHRCRQYADKRDYSVEGGLYP